MAAVTYTGSQLAVAKVMTLTVGTADPANAVTFTAGPTQSIAVKPSSSTTSQAASDFATALAAAGGAFSDLTFSASGAVVTITGPSDGAPFTFAKSDAGTNGTTLATTQSPKSPSDVGDPANYSTGALPVTGVDSLTLENSSVPLLYNLDALAAVALASPGFVRGTFTGTVGLPTTNPNGYPEYRPTELSLKTTAALVEQAGDGAQQLRLKFIDPGSAVTVTVTGDGGNAQVGGEALEIEGLPASSVVDVTGGSVAIAPLTGQACTVLTLLAVGATVRVGGGATLSGTVNLKDCQARIGSSWATSLTVDGGSAVEITGSAGGPAVVIEGGTVTWHSTGNPGAGCIVGSNGVLDLSTAPKVLTIGGTITVYEGFTIIDTAGRGGNYAVAPQHCALQDGVWQTVNGGTYTKS